MSSGYFNTNEIHEVTINDVDDDKNYYKTLRKADNFKSLAATTKIANKRLTLLSGNTGGKAWSVSVVASNVPKGYDAASDAATPDNAKSLITLFVVEGKKAPADRRRHLQHREVPGSIRRSTVDGRRWQTSVPRS